MIDSRDNLFTFVKDYVEDHPLDFAVVRVLRPYDEFAIGLQMSGIHRGKTFTVERILQTLLLEEAQRREDILKVHLEVMHRDLLLTMLGGPR